MGSTAVFLGRARFIGKFSRAQRSFTHLFLDIGCHDPIIDCTFFYSLVGQVIERKDIGSHVISDPLHPLQRASRFAWFGHDHDEPIHLNIF